MRTEDRIHGKKGTLMFYGFELKKATAWGAWVGAFFLLLPLSTQAQFYGGGPGMMYGGGMYGGGMMGPGMMGGAGGQGPGVVVVKYGEKIYDAVFGDLVDYKLQYIQVPADQIGVNYFDDGTHGDEVAYDGIPSLIIINRDTYLGPFSIRYKIELQKILEIAEKMGPIEFYRLGIVTEDKESKVAKISDWNQNLKGVLDDLRARLAQFQGYNDDKYVKSIDPALFETMEGGFGVTSGMGPGGYLPDLPPPPGVPQPNVRTGLPENLGGGLEPAVPAAPRPAAEPGTQANSKNQPQSNTAIRDQSGNIIRVQPNAPAKNKSSSPQPAGRFNPVQRARDAASAVQGRNQSTGNR